MYFSTFDLQSAFHQVGLTDDSRDKTAFLTSSGKYRYKKMPMGLKNAPNSFQALMEMVLVGIKYHHVLCYLDALVVFDSAPTGKYRSDPTGPATSHPVMRFPSVVTFARSVPSRQCR